MLDSRGTHLIAGLLPRQQVSILAGASGAGKSTLIFQMVARLQHNEPVFGNDIVPDLKIAYIRGDRSWEMEGRHMAEKAGVDLDHFPVWSLTDDLTTPETKFEHHPMELLDEQLGKMLPADLIIIDTLPSFFGCDTNAYHATAARLIRVGRWCKKYGITILGTHHSSKARTDFTFKRPQDRILGSAALLGFSSNHLYLMEPEEGGSAVFQLHVLDHLMGSQVHSFQRLPEGDPKGGLFVPWTPEMTILQTQQVLNALPDQQSVTKTFLVEAIPALQPVAIDAALRELLKTGAVVAAGHGRLKKAQMH